MDQKNILVSGKNTIKPHKCLNIMLLCYFHIKGLTLKPVRAGQGLGRGGA